MGVSSREPDDLKLVGVLFKSITCVVPIQQYSGMSVNVNVLLVLILGIHCSLIMKFGGSFLLTGILPSCQSVCWTR